MSQEKKPIEQIKMYWDTWITEWFKSCVVNKPNSGDQIQEWNIPISSLGNKENAYKYFPEPYWGNIDTPCLKGVFLNINPGGGNDLQIYDPDDLRNTNESYIDNLKGEFASDETYKYSKLVGALSENIAYITTKWMFNKRVKWLNDMDGLKKGAEGFRTNIADYLFFDLVPWHTPQKTDISDYCLTHAEQIYEHVLQPISRLAETVQGKYKDKIIVRGSTILDLFNKEEFKAYIDEQSISKWIILDSNKPLEKFSSLLTIFKLINSTSEFYVFSGGASMFLPNPEYSTLAIGRIESTTVKDIIQKTTNR
jgi:hypothetical protein